MKYTHKYYGHNARIIKVMKKTFLIAIENPNKAFFEAMGNNTRNLIEIERRVKKEELNAE